MSEARYRFTAQLSKLSSKDNVHMSITYPTAINLRRGFILANTVDQSEAARNIVQAQINCKKCEVREDLAQYINSHKENV